MKRSLFILIFAGFLVACSGPKEPEPTALELTVISSKNTNDGQVVYVSLFSMTENEFLSSNYQDISQKVFTADSSLLLENHAIMPDTKSVLNIDVPANQGLGIFVMFSNPSGKWNSFLAIPLAKRYEIKLGAQQIENEGELRGRWFGIF